MGRHKRYTEEQFIDAVKKSSSMRQVFLTLGIKATGGNYHNAKERINKLGLDISHHTGQGYLKGAKIPPRKPLNEILVENSTYSCSNRLRGRLIREKIFEYKCYKCGLKEWLGQPISLELEHINGNHCDNRIENLTLLCPNCHAQTPTYRGRKKKKNIKKYCKKCGDKIYNRSKTDHCKKCSNIFLAKKKRIEFPKEEPKCEICGKKTKGRGKNNRCMECYNLQTRKVERPSIEQLLKEIEETNFCAVGRKYGVSDNAIRKWIKK
jgi:hypothetical protein